MSDTDVPTTYSQDSEREAKWKFPSDLGEFYVYANQGQDVPRALVSISIKGTTPDGIGAAVTLRKDEIKRVMEVLQMALDTEPGESSD
jgi:hypothetical protein